MTGAMVVGLTSAAVPSTPSAVSTAFVQGYLTADPAGCDLATPRIQQLFARLAKGTSCKTALGAARDETDAVADKDARRTLRDAVQATQVLIDARAKAARTRRVWLAPHARVGALWPTCAHTTSRLVSVAGPSSARGTPTGLVLVDSARTTATKLVLYTESTSGVIWRLTSTPYRIGTPSRAGQGVAVHPDPAARAFVYRGPVGTSGSRVAVATMSDEFGAISFLLTLTPQNRVDAVLIGSLVTPLVAGTGTGDPASIADRLVHVRQQGDEKGPCAALHPRLQLSQSMFGERCGAASDPVTAVRVDAPGTQDWSTDGTRIVTIRVSQGNDAFTLHHVVTPLASGYAVTGLFLDFEELAARLLRPI